MWYLTMGQKSLLQNWKRQWAVSVSCKFRCVVDGYIWAFSGIYDPMQLGKEDNCGRNLQGYTVGGDLCVCVFFGGGGGWHLMSIIFLVKEWKQKGFPQPCEIFMISFQIRGRWIYHWSWYFYQVQQTWASMSKLDRFLITPHLEEYSNDHFPIMLDVNRINRSII